MKEIKAKIFEYTAELILDDNLTLINGDSGIGKTLLFNYFDRQSYNSDSIYCFNAKYIEKLKNEKKPPLKAFRDRLKTLKNALIIIDNAEVILDNKLREWISFDSDNTYIIFGRNVTGLWITENNIASLIRDNQKKRLYLDYYFKDVNHIDRDLDRR